MRLRMRCIVQCGLVAIVFVCAVVSCSQSGNGDLVAVYEDGVFYRSPTFTEFVSPIPGSTKLANVYVEVLDGQRFKLSELPSDVARKTLNVEGWEHDGEVSYFDGYTLLVYKEGRVAKAIIRSGCRNLRLGRNAEGPFLAFPIERASLIDVFGEPVEWKRVSKRPSGR